MPETPRSARRLSALTTARGWVAVVVVGSALVVCDLLQRTLVAAAARLFPRARDRILTAWIQAMRILVLEFGAMLVGGASFGPRPRLPAGRRVLVVMNHQSLLDIPLVVGALRGTYPLIVTRRRYERRIPLISHMIRLYQYPVVDPGATGRAQLDQLRRAVAASELSVVIFPEGTRSKTGGLGRWKRAGLRAILETRSWEVHVVVVDGLWRSRRFVDFVRAVGSIEGRMHAVGPFVSPPPDGEGDVDMFIDELKLRMEEAMAELRDGAG